MRSWRGALVALGVAVVAGSATSALFIGCGGDDNKGLPDAGADATSDAQSDAQQSDGPEVDVQQPDVLGDVVQQADAPQGDDGQTDGGDAGPGSDGDAGPGDGGDGGQYVIVTGAQLLAFIQQEATAYCTNFLQCCPGGLDGGSGYDVNKCVQTRTPYGWEDSVSAFYSALDGGNIAFSQAAATACLNAIQHIPCGSQSPADWAPATTACFAALQGTIPVNQLGCHVSGECAPGAFCDRTVDGGLCAPLVGQGQPCATKAPQDDMCSYVGSGSPALFCDLINNKPDAATCQPMLANGSTCGNATYYDDQACTSLLCGDSNQCGDTTSYPYPAFCTGFVIKDAGGGG